jgi:uncharacterized protein YkwD
MENGWERRYHEGIMKNKLSVKNHSLLLAGEFAAFGAGAVILLVFIASTLDASLLQNGQGAAVVTSALADLANVDRARNDLPELVVSKALTAAAQAKANDMAEKGYFAHTAPDGTSPWYWYKQAGYSFAYAGENLAIDFSDSADVEAAWMKSPAHRANLLNKNFTEVGIATAVGMYQGRKTTFVVEEFGTPAKAEVPLANPAAVPTTPEEDVAIAREGAPEVLGAVQEPQQEPKTVSAPEPTPSSVIALTPTHVEQGAAPTVVEKPEGLMALWRDFAASPKTTLRYAYYLFAILILATIAIETGFELRKHHARHVALALCLLALMGTLFVAADRMVFTTPTLGAAENAAGGT